MACWRCADVHLTWVYFGPEGTIQKVLIDSGPRALLLCLVRIVNKLNTTYRRMEAMIVPKLHSANYYLKENRYHFLKNRLGCRPYFWITPNERDHGMQKAWEQTSSAGKDNIGYDGNGKTRHGAGKCGFHESFIHWLPTSSTKLILEAACVREDLWKWI